jgi:4-hydroxythreonine-4-phosphate dehydrogenase
VSNTTPRLVITSGEPAGIGPDLVIELAQSDWPMEWAAIGNRSLFEARAQQLNLPIEILPYQAGQAPTPNRAKQIKLIDLPLAEPVKAGQLNVANADYVLKMLHRAIDGCLENEFDAMVTGPIHKGVINDAGIPFSGHTELLAERSHTEQVVMMLATPGLRVPLVTTHLPLRDVPDAITAPLLKSVIHILNDSLEQQFGIERPTIYVAGLNPHAGEGGHMGTEEVEIIDPALEQLREEGIHLIGALPADTLFTPKYMQDADAILAMYHDQGLPVLKHVGFGKAVNVTLGLPFIRTSVDHGTALDIAGKGIADANSFRYAIDVAMEMVQGQQPTAERP